MMMLVKVERISHLNKELLEDLIKVYLDGYSTMPYYHYKKRKDVKWYIRWLYRRDSDGIFIATYNNKPIGFIACDANWDEFLGAIHEIVVMRKFQRKGIGSKLLQTGLCYLKKKGIKLVELYVGEKNTGAIRFYKKFGFKEAGLYGIWLRMILEL